MKGVSYLLDEIRMKKKHQNRRVSARQPTSFPFERKRKRSKGKRCKVKYTDDTSNGYPLAGVRHR